jgi:hypothetical protein
MPEKAKPPAKHDYRLDVFYFIAAMFAVAMIRDYWIGQTSVKTIPYSEFRSLLR